MAFKMTRPTIEGSPIHKASIAKATAQPVVSQSRTAADGSLVHAADVLGKSNTPAAIDYKVAKPHDIKWTEEGTRGRESRRELLSDLKEDKRREDVLGDQYEDPNAPRYTDDRSAPEEEIEEIVEEEEEVVEEFVPSVFGEGDSDPFTYRTTESGGYQYLDTRDGDDAEWEDATRSTAIDAISKKDPSKQESVIQQRDSRIYRNALSGGSVRKKLTKNGYNPYK